MTDKPTDSTVGVPEITGVPTSGASSNPQGGEPSSTGPQFDQETVTRLAALLTEQLTPTVTESVRAKLAPDIERGIQKSKDRRWKMFEDLDPEDIRIVADAVKRNDGDFQKTADDLAVRAILEERRAKPADSSQPSASQAQPSSKPDKGMSDSELEAESLVILGKFELPDTEKEAVRSAWIAMEFDSEASARAGLVDLALKAKRGESVSGAGFVSPVGAIGTSAPEALASEKDRLYAKLDDLFVEPSKNREEIVKTKESLRKLGEPI